jgi:hypothetical protein
MFPDPVATLHTEAMAVTELLLPSVLVPVRQVEQQGMQQDVDTPIPITRITRLLILATVQTITPLLHLL